MQLFKRKLSARMPKTIEVSEPVWFNTVYREADGIRFGFLADGHRYKIKLTTAEATTLLVKLSNHLKTLGVDHELVER